MKTRRNLRLVLTGLTGIAAALTAATVDAGCPHHGGGRRMPYPIVRPAVRPVVRRTSRPVVRPVVTPVMRAVPAPAPMSITPADRALAMTRQAQKAFEAQDYSKAHVLMNRVLKLSPESASAYQFRALIRFAQAEYDTAAADIYDTLLRGSLWRWETVHPLYRGQQTYSQHYRSLTLAASTDEDSMAKHFLLAYHHLMLGHLEHGEKELQRVLEIQPQEPITVKLLGVVQTLKDGEAPRVAAR